MNTESSDYESGFTIVELLVVIVIIGILATISIVSYAGISQRAIAASLISNLSDTAKQLNLYQITNGTYPNSLSQLNNGSGAQPSPNTNLSYSVTNSTNPQVFCITATNSGQRYNVTQDAIPAIGPCPLMNLDAGSSSSYHGNTSLNDISGNGNSGTIANGATYNSGTISIDGNGNYVSVHSSSTLNGFSNTMSASVWVYPTIIDGAYRRFISRGSYPSQNWYIEFDGSQPGKIVSNGGASNATLSVNNWYNIVTVYDGSTESLYINGTLDKTFSYAGGLPQSTDDIGIGADADGSSSFAGLISQASIYDKALTSSEVQQNYNLIHARYSNFSYAPILTNLSTNPSFEDDSVGNHIYPTNWNQYGSTGNVYGGVANDFSVYGSKSFKVSETASMDGGIWTQITGLTLGGNITLSAYIKSSSTVSNASLVLTTSQHGLSGNKTASNNQGANANGRYSVTLYGLDQTAVNIFIGQGSFGTMSYGNVWFDGIMLTAGSSIPNYADGSSSGWAWNGASNNSTSFGPAL
ncbi:prepilin-type N-terminal cleavage/methylation domain-containing protein [Candidatus Saccharibacteria bacterium]|nr:prepilin-type N-terminal cleavage/methylation domain-containing protein [Candidatus Saccharibacteria bacterium]